MTADYIIGQLGDVLSDRVAVEDCIGSLLPSTRAETPSHNSCQGAVSE